MRFVPRVQLERPAALLRSFPAVLLVGPRQSGKSTLARHALPGWTHLDLERPLDEAAVAADLEGFLEANPRSLVIDEAQRLPELFPALRHRIDRGRGRGRFVLLVSASPGLVRSVSESLAGRVGIGRGDSRFSSQPRCAFAEALFDPCRPGCYKGLFGGW